MSVAITKLKIAICDDDPAQREYLHGIVTAWSARNHYLVELKQYEGAAQFLFDYESEKDFDILLLDIEMPGVNGIDLAKSVRKENHTIQIIFVTGFYEYFGDGFDVSALHYLIKPVDGAKLCPVLDKAVSNVKYRQRSVLICGTCEDVKVPLADILYVEAENVYINVHTVSETYRVRMSLGKFAEQLDDTFFKVHRSYIVGLRYLKKVTKTDVTLVNGDTVPVSRGKYDEIHGALIKYL